MLPEASRLRRPADFVRVTRTGRRCARPRLVLHLELVGVGSGPPRAGFVVSKAVGGAVVRNAVTRRLRALVAARLDRLPAGSAVVVRALPASAGTSSAVLAEDLDGCLDQLLRGPAPGAAP